VRSSKLRREIEGLERRIRTRTETLARQFDRVLRVLEALGYVRGFSLTDRGLRLARIYGEGDVLMAEALAEKVIEDMSAAETAALVSTFVYESRERVPRQPPEAPTAELRSRYRTVQGLWRRIREVEQRHQVELCRELDPGFMTTALQWAEGKALEDVLVETEMAPGDFVRTCKQLLDLLRQVEEVADGQASTLAREARLAVNRGVVSYTGV
jgi:ATP-dependent RNA helicase HelY